MYKKRTTTPQYLNTRKRGRDRDVWGENGLSKEKRAQTFFDKPEKVTKHGSATPGWMVLLAAAGREASKRAWIGPEAWAMIPPYRNSCMQDRRDSESRQATRKGK